MEFISTTATAVQKLKRLAKARCRASSASLGVALDAVAKEHGYAHWKHVTVCLEQTTHLNRGNRLPESLKNILNQAAKDNPASPGSQRAFDQGFVFALDVKDAEQLSATSEHVECDDGWYLAAKDVWQELIHSCDEETGTTLFETQSSEDLATTVLDDLENYRFFRYLGERVPASLEEAYKQIRQVSFFPPTHIWLCGRFIDLAKIPEIQIDGQVVLSSTVGSTAYSSDNGLRRLEKLNQLLTVNERALFDKMTTQEQDFWLLQLEKATPLGQSKHMPVHSSVGSSWQSAKKT
ncbi:hypothetical protein [Ralstonia solanacearum]|uniref:hypothetical protein n=1 Tax=Ralstonia solanacearum TaxID=305 RepID=UPI0001D9551B|nr:hypothetical protein [Ralstonia solanacearum]CBJ50985.1 hypothethical protein [Ralstonia solanacearum PSI07]